MIFLTLISPVVALTYPIDKINDGSAQGFNKWFREYIFNLLLQPLHLLLYFILVSSAFDLAASNYIYSTVAIAFMIPAEKLLRSLFGFEKAQTSGMVSAAAGGALAMAAIKGIGKIGKGKSAGRGSEKSGGSDGDEIDTGKINYGKGSIDSEDEILNQIGSGSQGTLGANRRNIPGSNPASIPGSNPISIPGSNPVSIPGSNPGNIPSGRFGRTRRFLRDQKNQLKAYYGPGLARNKVKLKNAAKRLPGKAIRFTGKMAGAATLGVGGALIGIAGGDPSNALSYASAAAGIGYVSGGKAADVIGSRVDSSMKIESPEAAYARAKNNPEYDRINLEKQAREIERKVAEKMENNGYSTDEINKFIEDKKALQYADYGVNDVNDILVCEGLQKEHGRSLRASIVANKNYRKIGDDLGTPKEKEWKEKYKDDFINKKGVNRSTAEKGAREAIKMIYEADKIKKKLR